MIALLAIRSLTYRPRRSALLLAGFGVGVGVMVVLLAIGEAMLAQASDERLVGGGDITVLPEGMDLEVMKTGGVGGLYLSIANARFVNLQLLSSPRLGDEVAVVSPQIDGKLLYLRTSDGREQAVRATGEIPSASRRLGALPPIRAGAWGDDAFDRRWMTPSDAELRHAIDRWHLPPARDSAGNSSWAEWHYFNVMMRGGTRWAFVSLMVAGDVPDGRWGGQVLVTVQGIGEPARRYVRGVNAADIRISETDANVVMGEAHVLVLPDGRYRLRATAPAEQGTGSVDIDLIVAPAKGAYFPGTMVADDAITSGYAVPALRASAEGKVCERGRCEVLADAPAYHDHNWGYWHNVDWEWGAARAGSFALLYGRVQQTDSAATPPPVFLYLVDSSGFRALFRPQRVTYEDGRTVTVNGRAIRVPSRAVLADARGADTLRVEIDVEDATGTDTRVHASARGRARARPYFIQMKGRIVLRGVIGGQRILERGEGFFETYR